MVVGGSTDNEKLSILLTVITFTYTTTSCQKNILGHYTFWYTQKNRNIHLRYNNQFSYILFYIMYSTMTHKSKIFCRTLISYLFLILIQRILSTYNNILIMAQNTVNVKQILKYYVLNTQMVV